MSAQIHISKIRSMKDILAMEEIILVTAIDRDSVEIVRKFLDIAIQVRHVKNMPPIDFAVSDKETKVATIEKTESIQMISESFGQ